MAPSMVSAWPPIYFVAAWIDTSTPCANGLKKSGVAQVLSRMTTAPAACAALAMAGMSCTSKVCEPGNSVNTTLVFLVMSLCDRAADQWVVIGGLDAEPLQHVIAEAPRRPIDAVRDEHLVAGRHESEQRGGDGRQAGRREQRAVSAFELGDRFFERPHRRRAEPPIGEVLIVRLERREGRKQHGRAAIDRRIDEAMLARGLAAGMREPRQVLLLPGSFAHLASARRGGPHMRDPLARLDGKVLIGAPFRPRAVID